MEIDELKVQQRKDYERQVAGSKGAKRKDNKIKKRKSFCNIIVRHCASFISNKRTVFYKVYYFAYRSRQ